jgi:hypothetical protein
MVRKSGTYIPRPLNTGVFNSMVSDLAAILRDRGDGVIRRSVVYDDYFCRTTTLA